MNTQELLNQLGNAETSYGIDGGDYVVYFKLPNGIELDFAVSGEMIEGLAFDGLTYDIENGNFDLEDYS